MLTARPTTVAIVGGGFSGAVFGLKLHLARPEWRVVIIEPKRSLGRGLAYGACDQVRVSTRSPFL